MREGVKDDVDPDGVAVGGKVVEVLAVLAFALESVAEVGVVGNEHDHVSVRIENRAGVGHGAVGSALGGAPAGTKEETNRGNLRQARHVVERMEQRMIDRQIDDRKR